MDYKRKKGDSNPRSRESDSAVFKTAAISRSATLPVVHLMGGRLNKLPPIILALILCLFWLGYPLKFHFTIRLIAASTEVVQQLK